MESDRLKAEITQRKDMLGKIEVETETVEKVRTSTALLPCGRQTF